MAVLVYVMVGLAGGAVARVARTGRSSLAGMLGTGGAAGVIGGVLANLLFDGMIRLDLVGLAGSVLLSVAAVVVVRASPDHPEEIENGNRDSDV